MARCTAGGFWNGVIGVLFYGERPIYVDTRWVRGRRRVWWARL